MAVPFIGNRKISTLESKPATKLLELRFKDLGDLVGGNTRHEGFSRLGYQLGHAMVPLES